MTIKYLKNCFLLLIPILVWNIAFRHLLPGAFALDVYWKDIPPLVFWGENFFRIFLYGLPMLMPLSFYSRKQKAGLGLYLLGIFMYFLTWRPLILYPESEWSLSLIGFVAPAAIPLISLIGIGLIGNRLFLNIPYRRRIYLFVSLGFVLFNSWHSVIVYNRLFE
jgi:hypothetical protein